MGTLNNDGDQELPRHGDWSKMLEWIEKQGQESLKARFATAELISKEAQTTLTVFLAGIGGAGAYGAKVIEPGSATPLVLASAVVCAYLVILAVLLVLLCMRFKPYPAQFQEPLNLMHPTYSIDDVREVEVQNIDKRIREASKINAHRATMMNRLRLAAVLTPAIFVVAAWSSPSASGQVNDRKQVEIACEMTGVASASAPAQLRCKASF